MNYSSFIRRWFLFPVSLSSTRVVTSSTLRSHSSCQSRASPTSAVAPSCCHVRSLLRVLPRSDRHTPALIYSLGLFSTCCAAACAVARMRCTCHCNRRLSPRAPVVLSTDSLITYLPIRSTLDSVSYFPPFSRRAFPCATWNETLMHLFLRIGLPCHTK